MASFNLRTYEADWGAQFSVENAQASLTYFLEADDDDPIPPTVAEVIAKIKELTGWTDTAVSPNGGLVRYLPQAHPIFQNLVAANVHVEPVRDEPKFTVLAPDPTEAREAEPVGPALAWGSWKFDVTFMPRPYPMISDARMEHTTDDWVDEDNNLQPIQYLPEWYRFCVFQTAPREEFVRGKLGDNARFVTGSGDRPNNVPYPAITTLPLPDDVLTVAFHNVPARWIESPNSYLRRFRNKINQKPWMGYEAGSLLYKSFKETRYSYPFPRLDPNWGGAGVFATERLTNLELEIWVTRRTITDPPAVDPGSDHLNFVVGGWNGLPWLRTRKFYYAAVKNADPLLRFPLFFSFNFGLLFRDPDSV